jgi:hypothetical protein
VYNKKQMKKTYKEKNTGIKGRFKITKTNSITGEVIEETPYYENIVVFSADKGLDLILDRLNGTNTYSLNITYLDIGTSSTAVAEGNTSLVAGVARTAKGSGIIVSKTLSLSFFFASGDLANGAYWEIGTFVDGTATLGTGQLFSRALFGSVYNKGTNEDTTINYQFTLSN